MSPPKLCAFLHSENEKCRGQTNVEAVILQFTFGRFVASLAFHLEATIL